MYTSRLFIISPMYMADVAVFTLSSMYDMPSAMTGVHPSPTMICPHTMKTKAAWLLVDSSPASSALQ